MEVLLRGFRCRCGWCGWGCNVKVVVELAAALRTGIRGIVGEG